MRTFDLQVRDTQSSELVKGVTSFVGSDGSGSFGIQAGHSRFLTALRFGLARFSQKEFRQSDFRYSGDSNDASAWRYLAMPGGILYFRDNLLQINTRRYFIGENYDEMTRILEHTLAMEEQQLTQIKQNLRQLEEGVLKRLWEMQHRRGTLM